MNTGPVSARPDVEALLSRMRDMRAQAQAGALETRAAAPAAVPEADRGAARAPGVRESGKRTAETAAVGGPAADFQSVFSQALDQVNGLNKTSTAAKSAFLRGEDIDLSEVMIASGKAEVAFQALTQVRNRLVSAYEDIMNMPI